MLPRRNHWCCIWFTWVLCAATAWDTVQGDQHLPTVLLPILARNKAHTLPQYLGYIDNLQYPKKRMALWIRTDHNVDNTSAILQEWVNNVGHLYHSHDFVTSSLPTSFPDELGPLAWPRSRFKHIINLREQALDVGRRMWADYIFYVDCDNILENPDVLQILMSNNKTLIAPMMESQYTSSNFWCGQDSEGYYRRTEDYYPILNRTRLGCFPVPVVHSTFLVDLRQYSSDLLTFDNSKLPGYNGPFDDIIIFAYSAQVAGVQPYICNYDEFGHFTAPLSDYELLEDDIEAFTELKLDAMISYSQWPFLWNLTKRPYGESLPMLVSKHISLPKRKKDSLGFDKVFLINLVRRSFRRERMLASLEELGIEVQVVDATDGQQLNSSWLRENNIKDLEGYEDPYHKRPMTMGEIGCFMSHYRIWEEIVQKGYNTVLLFEDDVRFENQFRYKLGIVMNDAKKVDWDLIYLGRKILSEKESWVKGAKVLVNPDYTYWTLSYAITLEGAKKLLDQKPLRKMVPVDEYLPIMYNKHPRVDWRANFSPRNLRTFAAEPMLVFPTHYTYEENYISDTEDSATLKNSASTHQPLPNPNELPKADSHFAHKHGEL